MTTADGSVVGTVKLIDHGPDESRWNLVILGDGFTSADLPEFERTVDEFVAHMQTVSPFSTPTDWDKVNVHRIDVESAEAGADSPLCDGTQVATYFDASFCADGIVHWLLGETATVFDVADVWVPNHDALLVFVNSTTYGGAESGGVGWVSLEPNNVYETAMHELGHAAFYLADEYEYGSDCSDDNDTYVWLEPGEYNITIATDLPSLKWATHVDPTTPIPTTTRNGDCSDCDTRTSPIADGEIGLFEGADHYRCNVFRPAYTCRMRDPSDPWCVVCMERVRSVLTWNILFDPTPCIVVTAAYGDPHHEDVEALRAWRDRTAAGHGPHGSRGAATRPRLSPALTANRLARPLLAAAGSDATCSAAPSSPPATSLRHLRVGEPG